MKKIHALFAMIVVMTGFATVSTAQTSRPKSARRNLDGRGAQTARTKEVSFTKITFLRSGSAQKVRINREIKNRLINQPSTEPFF